MKIIALIITACIFASCGMSAEEKAAREKTAMYAIGDIVYVKPDSTVGVIDGINEGCMCGDGNQYSVIVNHVAYTYKESLIFGKKE